MTVDSGYCGGACGDPISKNKVTGKLAFWVVISALPDFVRQLETMCRVVLFLFLRGLRFARTGNELKAE